MLVKLALRCGSLDGTNQLIQKNNNTVTQRRIRNVCQAALKVLAGLEDRILVATDAPLSFAGVFPYLKRDISDLRRPTHRHGTPSNEHQPILGMLAGKPFHRDLSVMMQINW